MESTNNVEYIDTPDYTYEFISYLAAMDARLSAGANTAVSENTRLPRECSSLSDDQQIENSDAHSSILYNTSLLFTEGIASGYANSSSQSCKEPQQFDKSVILIPQEDEGEALTSGRLVTRLCKRCHCAGKTLVEKRASTRAGMLALLLCVTCPPLFWLPLISRRCKEDVYVCLGCERVIGKVRPSFQRPRRRNYRPPPMPFEMHS